MPPALNSTGAFSPGLLLSRMFPLSAMTCVCARSIVSSTVVPSGAALFGSQAAAGSCPGLCSIEKNAEKICLFAKKWQFILWK